MPTIALPDIDGALITTAGAERQALVDAFAGRFGRADVFGGQTAPGVLAAVLAAR